MSMDRRDFLVRSVAGATVLGFAPPRALRGDLSPVRFGVCADVHKDIMHDADERLGTFVKAMTRRKADFLVQMGDFCQPIEKNRSFMNVWRSFKGKTVDVIGNHDMDGNVTRETTLAYMGLKRGYDTFIRGGFRFIVLDGNDKHDKAPSGYPRHIGAAQRRWLTRTLSETREPVVVFVHQSLQNATGIDNGPEVRAILEAANKQAGWGRVLACFSGHHHLDDVVPVNGIPYVQVNSMSYYWVGGSRKHNSYSEAIHAAHPWIAYTSPYEKPLWACVDLDPKGTLRIEGVRSRWVGPSPQQLGLKPGPDQQGVVPHISDRSVKLPLEPR